MQIGFSYRKGRNFRGNAYLCGKVVMRNGKLGKQQELRKKIKKKDKISRENLGKFFYDLAKVTYTAMVVGGVVILFSDAMKIETFFMVSVGIVATSFLALIGYMIFKR